MVDSALKLLFVLDKVESIIAYFAILHQIYSFSVLLKFAELMVIFFVLHLRRELWNVLLF